MIKKIIMKAEEIMIYNYVTFNGIISKVVAILPHYLYLRDVKGNPIYSIHETNLKPIEITEELLLKNGFRKDGMGYFKYYDHK